jgi:CheY-like chemotaxis protein
VIEELQVIAGASPSGRLRGILESLAEAQSGANRLRKIVRGLRAFAREDAPPAPTELHSVIEQSVNMSMHEIRQRATCVVEVDDVPLVEADDSRLSQVLVNLLCNAAQSFETLDPARNRITVRAVRLGEDQVQVSVTDNGPGIAPDVLARIFEPFYTTKSAGDGTGLGLAISQSIMQSFGGDLICDTQPGRGTSFALTLLSAQPMAQLIDATGPVSSHSTNGRIVVVDDEPAVIRMMSRVLSVECDVTCFTDPRRALEHLRTVEDVDLILCDLSMPHVSGMMLYETMRRERPDFASRFVFMSGGVTRDDLRQFLASVDNERLDKPFDLSQLRALVRREMNRRTNA